MLKLQLAAAIAKACHSEVEINTFLKKLTKPLIVPDADVDRECRWAESAETAQQRANIKAPSDDQPPASLSQVELLVDQSVEMGCKSNQMIPESGNHVECLKHICELQRQEIVKLRHELAENLIISPTDCSGATSSLLQKRPLAAINEVPDSQGKKKLIKNKEKKIKLAKESNISQNLRLEPEPTTTSIKECAVQHKTRSEPDIDRNALQFHQRFDTLSRIICLNQLLKYPNPSSLSPVRIDFLTLETIKEAALGLLASLHSSLDQVGKNVFVNEELALGAIPRMTNLIGHSVSSTLAPLFLPSTFSIGKSTRRDKTQQIWEDQILPIIYQKIESLLQEIATMILNCCEHLERSIFMVDQPDYRHAENIMVLRRNLQILAGDLFRHTASWTGNVQFNMIKQMLNILEEVYFQTECNPWDAESLGFLADLLRMVCRNISLEILRSESKLSEIQVMVGKILANKRYGAKRSLIIDRIIDRILMEFWSF